MKILFAQVLRTLLLVSCKLITGVQARWLNNPTHAPTIYYANHSSHLDGLVLWSCFPKHIRENIRPVAAQDYWNKTKFRLFLAQDVFNAVLINRKQTARDNPMTVLESALSQNQSLIIFPEGTRGKGESIADFRSGLYYMAKKFPNIHIVPVFLDNLNRVLPKGSSLLVPIICSAIFGKPILPLRETESKEDFLIRAKKSLEELSQ